MKASEVLKLLNISRITLYNYVKKGKISFIKLPNGFYDYNEIDVKYLAGNKKKFNVIYARVSTSKQKNDLQTQIDYIKNYCSSNNINIDYIFSDVDTGINLDREQFSKLLDLIINKEIDTIYISFKDRLSRLSFSTISQIFKKFGTKIVSISSINNTNEEDDDYNDLFDDLTSLMHYFSTKKYSNRKKIINK